MLGQFRCGYKSLGQVKSRYVRFYQVSLGEVSLEQFMSGYIRLLLLQVSSV